MTRHTTRDRIWNAALDVAEEKSRESSSWSRSFSASDVAERFDDEDAPAVRTIRDTLATMADLGWLDGETRHRQGEYVPAEGFGDAKRAREQLDTVLEQFGELLEDAPVELIVDEARYQGERRQGSVEDLRNIWVGQSRDEVELVAIEDLDELQDEDEAEAPTPE